MCTNLKSTNKWRVEVCQLRTVLDFFVLAGNRDSLKLIFESKFSAKINWFWYRLIMSTIEMRMESTGRHIRRQWMPPFVIWNHQTPDFVSRLSAWDLKPQSRIGVVAWDLYGVHAMSRQSLNLLTKVMWSRRPDPEHWSSGSNPVYCL